MMKECLKFDNYLLCRKVHNILKPGGYGKVAHNGIAYPEVGLYMSYTKTGSPVNEVYPKFGYKYTDKNGINEIQYVFINKDLDLNSSHLGFDKGFIMNHDLFNRVNYAGFMFRAKIHGLISMESITQEEKVYLFNILHEKTNRDLYMYAYSTRDGMIKNMYENCYNGYENLYSNM